MKRIAQLGQELAELRTMLESLRADAARYPGQWYWEPGFWATTTYRWGRWARALKGPARALALAPQKVFNQYFHIVHQIDISPDAKIGPGLVLVHPRNVLIGGCKIGKNCLIFQEVTLGMDANSKAFPELGDGVDIYAGARVIGAIRLGNDVKVGANCVVSQSVADGCTVVVAKNRVIPRSLVEAFGPRRAAARQQPQGTPSPAPAEPEARAPLREPEMRPAIRDPPQLEARTTREQTEAREGAAEPVAE